MVITEYRRLVVAVTKIWKHGKVSGRSDKTGNRKLNHLDRRSIANAYSHDVRVVIWQRKQGAVDHYRGCGMYIPSTYYATVFPYQGKHKSLCPLFHEDNGDDKIIAALMYLLPL